MRFLSLQLKDNKNGEVASASSIVKCLVQSGRLTFDFDLFSSKGLPRETSEIRLT
jgi:hypothetical protein